MLVLLALLNDLPIMTVAYDNVKYSDKPEEWDMRTLLGIATFLGVIGVFSSFGMLYIGLIVLKLNPLVLQSLIYLKLSAGGHLTVFVARTKGHFWSVKPAKPLFFAIIATQLTATIITVYGILLPAMGWGLAAFVWGYALLLFVVTDFAKVRLYKLLNTTGARTRKGKNLNLLNTVPLGHGFQFFTEHGKNTGITASSTVEFAEKLQIIPIQSVVFHFQRKDFQKWFKNTVGDEDLAKRIGQI
jgi:hypothetical protein